MTKSNTISSSRIRFGKRTYFFDLNKSANDKKYLKITESKFMGEGKERVYNSFLLFPEEVKGFKEKLEEAAGSLAG